MCVIYKNEKWELSIPIRQSLFGELQASNPDYTCKI